MPLRRQKASMDCRIGAESAEHVHALRFSHHRVTRRRGVQRVTERTGERSIRPLDRVGVDPQRHRRVGVAEASCDGAHVVPTRDRGGRGPVPQIVETPLAVDSGLLTGSGPPPSDAIGVGGPGRVGEQVGRDLLAIDAQLIDRVDRRGVEGEGSTVAGLGRDVFDPRLPIAADDRRAAVDGELVACEIGPLERGELGPAKPRDGGKAQRDTGSGIEVVCRSDRGAHVVGRHPIARLTLRLAQYGLAGRVASHPLPPQCLRERGTQHRMATADRRLPHARLAHPRVPPLDVGDAETSDGHRGERVGLDPGDAALVVTPRRLRPDRLVDVAPRGQHVGDRATGGVRRRSRLERRRDALRLALGAANGAADLRRSTGRVASGEHPDLPHPRLALPQGRHADDRSTSRDL